MANLILACVVLAQPMMVSSLVINKEVVLPDADDMGLIKMGNMADEQLTGNWFGNYMTKVAYSLFKADQCGKCGGTSMTLAGKDTFGLLKKLFAKLPLQVDIGQQDAQTCAAKVSGSACDNSPPHAKKEDAYPHWNETKRLFNKHLYPALADQAGLAALRKELADTLVVHLRGTDILTDANHLDYMPAPCAYVHDVIEKGNFEKIELVTDDASHPCIAHIQQKYPQATYKKRSLVEDYKVLMSATNFAMSTSSTFGLSAVLMFPEKHGYLAMPTYEKVGHGLCCEGNFDAGRFAELCDITELTSVYEHPYPQSVSSKRAYIVDNEHFKGTNVHKCN